MHNKNFLYKYVFGALFYSVKNTSVYLIDLNIAYILLKCKC